MTSLRLLAFFVLIALAACGSQAQDQGNASPAHIRPPAPIDSDAARPGAPPKPLSADAEAPTGEPKEKEQRGNTPPGMDRSGARPAEGAIVDPAGVTQK